MGEFYPLFMEEIFIVNIYGTEAESNLFYKLMQDTKKSENVVELAALIEDIKRRELTKMDWYCCYRCDKFHTCKINWYRGERTVERKCCSYCQSYEKCLEEMRLEETIEKTICPEIKKKEIKPPKPLSNKKLFEEIFIINLYGDSSEINFLNNLLEKKETAIEKIVDLTVLVEDIKKRELTHMCWYCCHRCNNFTTCQINWRRGESDMNRHCCSYCQNYEKCLLRFKLLDKPDK